MFVYVHHIPCNVNFTAYHKVWSVAYIFKNGKKNRIWKKTAKFNLNILTSGFATCVYHVLFVNEKKFYWNATYAQQRNKKKYTHLKTPKQRKKKDFYKKCIPVHKLKKKNKALKWVNYE